MNWNRPHQRCCNKSPTIHKIVCQHQVEVEIWPAQAEVYFQDEAYIDPVNTQIRFDAVVNNAPSSNVHWDVTDIAGNQGAGEIDQAGLYIAPEKGSNPHGLTDIVVATSIDDPMRKAYATVSLIGFGPEPKPEPRIEVFPKQVNLYYPTEQNMEYIDPSNTMQYFRVFLHNSPTQEVEWKRDDGPAPAPDATDDGYLYKVFEHPGAGNTGKAIWIEAEIKNTGIMDRAKVVLINYSWPGIVNS